MDFNELLEVVDNLPDDDLERLKTHITKREQSSHKPRTVEEWIAKFANIAAEFRGTSSDEEMREIIEAMTLKSPPSEKGL